MSQEKMINWYNDSLNQYGEKDFRSLTWGNTEGTSAKARYETMNLIHSFSDKNIIEFGCGWGSFFDFGFTCKSYYGLDINSNFIELAKTKYPNYQFEQIDILAFNNLSNVKYDLAISSGVAGNQGGPADHPLKLKKYLSIMLNASSKVIVNFPSTWATIRSENIEYFSPSSTLEIALSITNNVQLIHKTNFDFLLILEQ
jgi:trans-aconitate methyltransferase